MDRDKHAALDPGLQHFVERMGLLWENDGLPRIAGRIFGLLLVTPGACSLDDLAETLGVSKASISTDARRLEQLGFLERTSRPGDRRDYYRASNDLVERSLQIRLDALRKVRRLLAEAPRPHGAPEVAARLDDFERVHRYAEDAVGDVLARWKHDAAARAG
ncbi:MAG TPA: MarR family transcriptional regulator [Gemmatimonadaceae bacterium]